MIIDDIKITPLYNTARMLDVGDKEYHTRYFDYISNSRLSLINPEQGGTPEKFFGIMPQIYSDNILLGSAIHAVTLQRDKYFIAEPCDRPTAKLGFVCDELYEDYRNGVEISSHLINEAARKIGYYISKPNQTLSQKRIDAIYEAGYPYWMKRKGLEYKYRKEGINKTPIYLSDKDRIKANTCEFVFDQHLFGYLKSHDALCSGNEKTFVMDCIITMPSGKEYTFKLKGKADNYNITDDTIIVNDVKTVSDIGIFDVNVEKFRYMREMAMYCWLIGCASQPADGNHTDYNYESNFLVVSTRNDDWYIKPMTKKLFREGWKELQYLLRLVAYYYDKGYRFEQA